MCLSDFIALLRGERIKNKEKQGYSIENMGIFSRKFVHMFNFKKKTGNTYSIKLPSASKTYMMRPQDQVVLVYFRRHIHNGAFEQILDILKPLLSPPLDDDVPDVLIQGIQIRRSKWSHARASMIMNILDQTLLDQMSHVGENRVV